MSGGRYDSLAMGGRTPLHSIGQLAWPLRWFQNIHQLRVVWGHSRIHKLGTAGTAGSGGDNNNNNNNNNYNNNNNNNNTKHSYTITVIKYSKTVCKQSCEELFC